MVYVVVILFWNKAVFTGDDNFIGKIGFISSLDYFIIEIRVLCLWYGDGYCYYDKGYVSE